MMRRKIYTRFIVIWHDRAHFAPNLLFNGKPLKIIEFSTIKQSNVRVFETTDNHKQLKTLSQYTLKSSNVWIFTFILLRQDAETTESTRSHGYWTKSFPGTNSCFKHLFYRDIRAVLSGITCPRYCSTGDSSNSQLHSV